MSTIEDFNRIEDCNKISAKCVNAYIEASLDEDEPSLLKIETSWDDNTVDLSPAVQASETLTTLYLSPSEAPNCLVYEPEKGGNVCIHGDDLSRIISMQRLKDVTQDEPPLNGDVYMYNGTTEQFVPFDLQSFVDATNTAINSLLSRMTTLEQTIANHESRLQTIETKLTPPADAPAEVKVVFGNINTYSDPNAVVDSNGNATSLDKTHGLYTHNLSTTAYGDELFG